MPFPISVVVPLVKSREVWFEQRCLPSIRENDPAEVIVEDGEGDLCEKRNAGAAKATQPFIIFVDDNVMFYEWAFKKMLRTLEEIKDVSFVYCDSRTMIQKGALTARLPGVNKSKPWDPETLKDGNYVHVTSLLRREAFPGFDTVARIAEGGDLWTTLAAKGHKGLYISEVLFEVHERA